MNFDDVMAEKSRIFYSHFISFTDIDDAFTINCTVTINHFII